jgi:hypothetical protein
MLYGHSALQKLYSDGIRAGNAVRFQLWVKLTHYSGLNGWQESGRSKGSLDSFADLQKRFCPFLNT